MSNKLFVISGASGSGKSTIIKSIMDNEIISFTTRQPRPKERSGIDYMFITKEEFEDLLHNDGLMEYTSYSNNYYGVTRKEFENKLSEDDAFFISDLNGLKRMKKLYGNIVSIFIYCDKELCEANMRERGDSEDLIQKRLSTYEDEIENLVYYDYIVVNEENELDLAIEKVRDIIEFD